MAGYLKRRLIGLWLCILMSRATSRTLCPRIFFQNIDENKMPYKVIEGVFVKQSYTLNKFPVYEREDAALQLYYHKGITNDSLQFGFNGDYFGLAASVLSNVTGSDWLSSSVDLDRDDVFRGLISVWYYRNDRDKQSYPATSSPRIKAICVDEDFRECNSDRVYFNVNFSAQKDTKVLTNNASTDYFRRVPGVFRNLRPVYKHRNQSWILQYTADQYWLVATTTSFPITHNNDSVVMRVKDVALRPEYITKIWSVYNHGWRDISSLKVKCRGIASMTNTCHATPCRSGSTCVYTSGNETVCICSSGYIGIRCDIKKQCVSPPSPYHTEMNFKLTANRPGDLALAFCKEPNPSNRFAVCQDDIFSSTDNAYWIRKGTSCAFDWSPTKAIPSDAPDAKPIDFDDVPGIVPGILVTAIVLQIFPPFVVWCCAFCLRICKKEDEETENKTTRQRLKVTLQRRLEIVANAEDQEELDEAIRNYRETVQQSQNEIAEAKVKHKKKLYRNVSLWRLISMHLFFSFYFWLIYLILYKSLALSQEGVVLVILYLMSIVMLVVSPIIVLIESYFSHELQYLKNIMKDESATSYIQKMQRVAPVITMKVECYHWETRTKTVHYTDASGNLCSRTETYQERVVTFVDKNKFSYGSWVDASSEQLPDLSTVAVTRIKIDLHVFFGDKETTRDFKRQKDAMLERNKHRDQHMDFSFTKTVPGLAERISAYVDFQRKPWWIRPRYFWLATLLFMSWPYRWLFRARTTKTFYDLNKRVYKRKNPPKPVDVMDRVERNIKRFSPSFPTSEFSALLHDDQHPSLTPSYPGVPCGLTAPENSGAQALSCPPTNVVPKSPPASSDVTVIQTPAPYHADS